MKWHYSAVFLVLLLVLATEKQGARLAEGRTCEALSGKFKGLCFLQGNCISVCKKEGFTSGYCKGSGVNYKCVCTRPC